MVVTAAAAVLVEMMMTISLIQVMVVAVRTTVEILLF